jgi:hypothetical protein
MRTVLIFDVEDVHDVIHRDKVRAQIESLDE